MPRLGRQNRTKGVMSQTVSSSLNKRALVIARQIVQDIVRQRLAPGASLPSEAAMLERFGVGRPSLREALRILEVHGLISIRTGPGGGPVVQPVSSRHFGQMATLFLHVDGATFRELVEARLALEPMMARWAATRQLPEAIARLQASIANERWLDLDDSREQIEQGIDFHFALLEASGNRVLNLLGKAIAEIYAERITGVIFPLEARCHVRDVHAAIVDAIAVGDADTAEALTRDHMQEVVLHVEQRYPGFLDERVMWR